jgi:hypothetical protein
MNICLELLKKDFDDFEAHSLILETFHTLGFKNEVAINTKVELKNIMLDSN